MLLNLDLRQSAGLMSKKFGSKFYSPEENTARSDGLVRETFVLPRNEARDKARHWLEKYPAAAYWTRVESWKELDDGSIKFTMVRLPNAD